MKIKTLLRKGFDHRVFCEDYLCSYENENWIIAGVFDGCSGGIESHFASALSGKIIKQYAKLLCDKYQEGESDIMFMRNFLMSNFFYNLETFKKALSLSEMELLSTMILLIYNKKYDTGHVFALGDGIIMINGNITIIDQNNEPDYPVMHIDKINKKEGLIKFLEENKNQWNFTGLEDIIISTDGLQQFKNKTKDGSNFEEAMNFLIIDKSMEKLDVMLARKYNILKTKGWENYDDIGLIRIMQEEKNEKEKKQTEAVISTDN